MTVDTKTPRRCDLASVELAFGTALFFLAFAPRIYVALATRGEAIWDGHYYEFGARRMAAGFGYSDDIVVNGMNVWHPWCHYPVGYSAFLAGTLAFFRMLQSALVHVSAAFPPFGWLSVRQEAWVIPFANALVGSLLAVVTWLLARHGLSSWRAKIAGIIVALYPGLVLYAGLVMSEPLASLLMMTAFWLTWEFRSARIALLVGSLVLGVGVLVRPQALLCIPFLPLRLWHERSPRFDLKQDALRVAWPLLTATAFTLVPVLPWTVRNCRVMDGCALVSTNAGWNLAIGSFPRATGRFETLRAEDGCRVVTGQVQQDRCWFEFGLAQIRSRPIWWLSLMPEKWSQTFDHESFPIEYLGEARRPSVWSEADRFRGRSLLTSSHRLLLLVASLGGVAFARRARGATALAQGTLFAALLVLLSLALSGSTAHFWPFAIVAAVLPWIPIPGRPKLSVPILQMSGVLATIVATHALFFGEDRYHMVAIPALAILAASTLRNASAWPGRQGAL